MNLQEEYSTLREEILQLFREQSQLAFATAISAAAIVFGLFRTGLQPVYGLVILETVLAGIALKLVSNYDKIYRSGTYLMVVHELKGDQNRNVTIGDPAWHTRSRRIGARRTDVWRWGNDARADAWFLLVLGFGGLVFSLLATDWSKTALCVTRGYACLSWELLGVIVGGLGLTILFFVCLRLFATDVRRNRFEEALWEELRQENERATRPATGT